MTAIRLKKGDAVGAQRWPGSSNHPDCWGPPWKGQVLEETDPRAWANTLAFPVASPDPDKVAAHVAQCRTQGMVFWVPVLWDFGTEQRCYWTRPEDLRSYAEDYLHWIQEREKSRKTWFVPTKGAINAATAIRAYAQQSA